MTTDTYEQMLEAAPDFYCIINPDGHFVHVNSAATRILGYQPSELTGKPFLDMVVADDRKETLSAFRSLLQGKLVAGFTNHYYRKDGSVVALLWSSNWNGEKQLVYGLGHLVGQPLAQRKNHRLLSYKRKRPHHWLLQAYDKIMDGYLAVDNNWRITQVNKNAETITENCKAHFVGRSFWECFPKTVGSIFEQEYKRALLQQLPVRFEAYYPEPLYKWFDISACPSPSGLSIFFRDITEHKKLEAECHKCEQKVREQHQHLTEILERITDAFFAVDRHWCITYWNHQAEQVTGKKREEVMHKSLFACFPKALGTTIESSLYKALSEQVPVFFEAPLQYSHGC